MTLRRIAVLSILTLALSGGAADQEAARSVNADRDSAPPCAVLEGMPRTKYLEAVAFERRAAAFGDRSLDTQFDILDAYAYHPKRKRDYADFYRVADALLARTDATSNTYSRLAYALEERGGDPRARARLVKVFDAIEAYLLARGFDPGRRYNAWSLAPGESDPVKTWDEVHGIEFLAALATELGRPDADRWALHAADAGVTYRASCVTESRGTDPCHGKWWRSTSPCGDNYPTAEAAYRTYERLGDAEGMRAAARKVGEGALWAYGWLYASHDREDSVRFHLEDGRAWLRIAGLDAAAIDALALAELQEDLEEARRELRDARTRLAEKEADELYGEDVAFYEAALAEAEKTGMPPTDPRRIRKSVERPLPPAPAAVRPDPMNVAAWPIS